MACQLEQCGGHTGEQGVEALADIGDMVHEEPRTPTYHSCL